MEYPFCEKSKKHNTMSNANFEDEDDYSNARSSIRPYKESAEMNDFGQHHNGMHRDLSYHVAHLDENPSPQMEEYYETNRYQNEYEGRSLSHEHVFSDDEDTSNRAIPQLGIHEKQRGYMQVSANSPAISITSSVTDYGELFPDQHRPIPDCGSCDNNFTDDEIAGGWHMHSIDRDDDYSQFDQANYVPKKANERIKPTSNAALKVSSRKSAGGVDGPKKDSVRDSRRKKSNRVMDDDCGETKDYKSKQKKRPERKSPRYEDKHRNRRSPSRDKKFSDEDDHQHKSKRSSRRRHENEYDEEDKRKRSASRHHKSADDFKQNKNERSLSRHLKSDGERLNKKLEELCLGPEREHSRPRRNRQYRKQKKEESFRNRVHADDLKNLFDPNFKFENPYASGKGNANGDMGKMIDKNGRVFYVMKHPANDKRRLVVMKNEKNPVVDAGDPTNCTLPRLKTPPSLTPRMANNAKSSRVANNSKSSPPVGNNPKSSPRVANNTKSSPRVANNAKSSPRVANNANSSPPVPNNAKSPPRVSKYAKSSFSFGNSLKSPPVGNNSKSLPLETTTTNEKKLSYAERFIKEDEKKYPAYSYHRRSRSRFPRINHTQELD